MKKTLFFLCLSLFFCGDLFAVTKYARAAGGNWGTAATWALSSGGTESTTKPAAGDDVILDVSSGNVVMNENSAQSLKSFDMTGYAGTFSGTSTLNVGGATGTTQNIIFGGTISWTGTLNIRHASTNAHMNLTSGGKTIKTITTTAFTGATATNTTLQENLVIGTGGLSIANGTRFTLNTYTISGTDATTGRILIKGGTLGGTTYINMVPGAGTFANADFRDIYFSSATDIDLSAITGLSGDCGGNAITGGGDLTFTPSAEITWDGAGAGNWSDVLNWTNTGDDRVPLPQDDVIIGAADAISVDMPRIGRDISFTAAGQLDLANAVTSYGSLNFTGGGSQTLDQTWTFESSERTGTHTLTSDGETFAAAVTNSTAGTAVLALGDAFSSSSTFTCGSTSSLNLGSYIHTFSNSSAATVFTGAGTITEGTSTIAITDTGANAKTFAGGGKTYYNLTTPSGTGGVTITGSNSFNTIQAASGGKITFTAGTTQTITGSMATGFGNSTNVLTITSTTTTPAILKLTGTPAYVNADYLALTYNTGQNSAGATATNTWYYGSNSTVGDGVTGWNSGVYTASSGRNLLISDVTPSGEGHIGGF